jgi:hypothetical protein
MTQITIRKLEPPTALPSSSSFTAFLIGQIECAKLRAEITINQCDMAVTALSGGLISPEAALLILHEAGLEISS